MAKGDIAYTGDGSNHQWSMQGSGKSPYLVKYINTVWSCSCPAWRNQSKPIDQRSCKHCVAVAGFAGMVATLPSGTSQLAAAAQPKDVPPVQLAEKWEGQDPTGYYASEKLDGVRAWWDGKNFISRQGNIFNAPDWFKNGLPHNTLDGELWTGRGKFQETVSIVRQADAGDLWTSVFYMVFDMPKTGTNLNMDFEARWTTLVGYARTNFPQAGDTQPIRLADKAYVLPQNRCGDEDDLMKRMDEVMAKGGEGLMLKKAGSLYTAGRTTDLLKVKRFHDAEAVVTGHQPGKGRHDGVMGALELLDYPECKVAFKVGSGFTDEQRRNALHYFPVGTIITYRYQELTNDGVPRFPTFVRNYQP
jgi:DNA ligase-1